MMADDDDDPPPRAAGHNNNNSDDTSALHDAIRDGHDLEAIMLIVQESPHLLRLRCKRSGRLPLHASIGRRLPPSVTRYLLEQHPDAVREDSGDISSRGLPAHVACRNKVRWNGSDGETARLVIEAWPGALQVRNASGDLPLHLATDYELIRFLVQTCPDSVQEVDGDRGMTVLHLAVENGADAEVIEFLVEACPQLVRTKDKHGQIPLHCISDQTQLDAVESLVSQDREALHALDNEGRVPLHSAVENEGWGEVVDFLIDAAPQSVHVRTSTNGSLPIHLAIQNIEYDPDGEFAAVRSLVEAWPESLQEATAEGLLPLHCAAQCAKFPLVRLLAEECPESVRVKTGEGWLALHLVLELTYGELLTYDDGVRTMYETARFLMEEFPLSVLELTNEGYTPLHVAAMTGYGFTKDDDDENMEVEFFRDLVGRAPAAVRVASHALLFPFQYAIRQGHVSVAAVQFLAEQFPDAVRQLDEGGGRTAMHMAVSRNQQRLDYVRLLAELRPQLLEATDGTGSTPMHTAAAQVQSYLDVALGWSREAKYREPVESKLRTLLDIVQCLAEQRPRSLVEADCRGAVPLHVAVARIVPHLDMVRLMVQVRPEALLAADTAGSLPLHVAVALNQPTPELEEFVAAKARQSEDDGDNDHEDPAAIAVRVSRARRDNARTLELVQLLVEGSPRSVRHKNGGGLIPLLVAAENDAPLDVLLFLATAWPEAIYGSRRGYL
jgi:ankyrin repeat protein